MHCAASDCVVALTPMRTSLEAYFVEKLRRAETTAGSTK